MEKSENIAKFELPEILKKELDKYEEEEKFIKINNKLTNLHETLLLEKEKEIQLEGKYKKALNEIQLLKDKNSDLNNKVKDLERVDDTLMI